MVKNLYREEYVESYPYGVARCSQRRSCNFKQRSIFMASCFFCLLLSIFWYLSLGHPLKFQEHFRTRPLALGHYVFVSVLDARPRINNKKILRAHFIVADFSKKTSSFQYINITVIQLCFFCFLFSMYILLIEYQLVTTLTVCEQQETDIQITWTKTNPAHTKH